MKNLFIVIVAVIMVFCVACGTALSAEPYFKEMSVNVGTIDAAAGAYNNYYVGPFDISGCYDVVDLALSTAEVDSMVANVVWWASVTYKSGDTMNYNLRGIATVYNTPPANYSFDWSDSVGSNTKVAVLLGDTVETMTKRGVAFYDQGSVGGDYMLPYVWVEFDPDTLALDTLVKNVVVTARVLCPGSTR